MTCFQSSRPHRRICRQYIIYIIKSFIIRADPIPFHSKRQTVPDLNVSRVKPDVRSSELTLGTGIVAKLAVIVKPIGKRRAAAFADPPFPDLTGICVIRHLFTDPVCHIIIPAVHSQISRQRVVPIHDHFHLRRRLHDFFQDIHRNINLPVTVKLVAEQIQQQHVIRAQARQHVGKPQLIAFEHTPLSRRLLEHGFNSFSRKTILDKIEPIATIRVELCASQDYVTVQPTESLSAILPNDLDPALFQRDTVLPTEPLQAPIEKGTVLGTITISYAGTTYGTVDLVASTSLERSQFLYVLERIRWVFSHLWVRLLLLAAVILILVFALRRMVYGPSRRRKRRGRERAYSSSYRGRGR